MRIFDSVHGLISFAGEYRDLGRVLDTHAFQRLRRIRQLGFSDLVYPGATHSRFAHSVGVFHNARLLLQIARAQLGKRYDPKQADIALAAALLHDIGHGPFSHVFEDALEQITRKKHPHEKWSCDIILQDDELVRAVQRLGVRWDIKNLAEKIADLLEKNPRNRVRGLYAEVVSSQFDADRMDYLVRDVRATGVDIGNFDREWLLDCLRVEQDPRGEPRWVIHEKGRQAVEAYILARVQFHETIYRHPTTGGYEILFTRMLTELFRAVKNDALVSRAAANPLAAFLGRIARKETPGVADYIAMDDAAAWTLINELARHERGALRVLARRLAHRRSLSIVGLEPLPRQSAPGETAAQIKKRLKQFSATIQREFELEPWQYKHHVLDAYRPAGRRGRGEPDIRIRTRADKSKSRPIHKASPLVANIGCAYFCRVHFDQAEPPAKLKRRLQDCAREFRAQAR